VQGVGFRYEAWLIAQKLELTGFAENLPSGKVRMEIQGPKNKIMHLIKCMESIPRIVIENKVMFLMCYYKIAKERVWKTILKQVKLN
jgi:acylphosphatase